MIELTSQKKNLFFEYYYYWTYLFLFFNISIYAVYEFFFFKIYAKFKFLLQFLFVNITYNWSNNKKINAYANLKINNKINYKTSKIKTLNNEKIIKYYFSNNPIFKTKLFNLFSLFNYLSNRDHFYTHYHLKLFYLQNVSNNIMIIDSKKFLLRWSEALCLLFNVFFYNFNSIILGSPFFKNETLALNWNHTNFEINLWKYYFPFFIFKLNTYNSKMGFFFEKLELFGTDFFLIPDCFYHYKNLFYIRKKRYYTVGLVNTNLSPWLVTYPIISFFESLVTQLFFFKLLLLIQKQTIYTKFLYLKNLWIKFLLINFNKSTNML